jgi:hypothetical protein
MSPLERRGRAGPSATQREPYGWQVTRQGLSLTAKMSSAPALERGPPPKSAVP